MQFSSRTDVFPKNPIIFKIYVEFGAFCYQICHGSKNFAFGLSAGKLGKFGLKALFVSCAFIVCVAEVPADHESPWTINQCSLKKSRLEIKKAQVFKTVKFSIDFIQRS